MALNRDHDEKTFGSSLPSSTGGEGREDIIPKRPRTPTLRREVKRVPLVTWEHFQLTEKFADFPKAAAKHYTRVERFIDCSTDRVHTTIRTVVVEWSDGRKTEYRCGRLRGYNSTNRRTGLRGHLFRKPKPPEQRGWTAVRKDGTRFFIPFRRPPAPTQPSAGHDAQGRTPSSTPTGRSHP